jgi:hypothetical protein
MCRWASIALWICVLVIVALVCAMVCAHIYLSLFPPAPTSAPRITGGRESCSNAFTKALTFKAIPPSPVSRQLLELDPVAIQTRPEQKIRRSGGCCDGNHAAARGCPRIIARSAFLYEEIGMPRELVSLIVEYAPACCIRSRIGLLPTFIRENHPIAAKLRSLPYEELRYVDECPSTTLNYLRWLVCALAAVREEFGANLPSAINYEYETDTTNTTEAKLWLAAAHSPEACLFVEILVYEALELNHRIGAPEVMDKAVKEIATECDEAEVAKRLDMSTHHDTIGALMTASAFPNRFEWTPILQTHRCVEHDPATCEDGSCIPAFKRWPFSQLLEARLEALSARIASSFLKKRTDDQDQSSPSSVQNSPRKKKFRISGEAAALLSSLSTTSPRVPP